MDGDTAEPYCPEPPPEPVGLRDYCVNATVSFPACLYVTASSEQEATEIAKETPARYYDHDTLGGLVEFNVTPEVEAV